MKLRIFVLSMAKKSYLNLIRQGEFIMGRRKKTETVVENPTPMEEGAMNLSEESGAVEEKTEVSSEKVEEKVENSLEKVEDNVADAILGAENIPVVEEKKEPVQKVVVTTASKVNVRKVPNGDVLFMINNGSQVMVEEEKNGWSKVTGYIMTELLK